MYPVMAVNYEKPPWEFGERRGLFAPDSRMDGRWDNILPLLPSHRSFLCPEMSILVSGRPSHTPFPFVHPLAWGCSSLRPSFSFSGVRPPGPPPRLVGCCSLLLRGRRGAGAILFHYSSPCSQLGFVYIDARVGFDLAVSLPTHIHFIALQSHNVTTIQIAPFSKCGGAIEHYKTNNHFLPSFRLRHLQFIS